jgi:DNA-binding IclR family transcriptional regulator
MSLARTLGIPRETVRRKLVELHDEGWIIPDGRNLRYQPSQRLLRTLADLLPPRQGSA